MSLFQNYITKLPLNFEKPSIKKDKMQSKRQNQGSSIFSPKSKDISSTLDSEKVIIDRNSLSNKGEMVITVNKLRVHYFFSETRNIQNFIDNALVTFKLLDANKKIIAEAKSNVLRNFVIHARNILNAEKELQKISLFTTKFQRLQIEVIFNKFIY